MKKTISKLTYLFTALVFFTSAIFLGCGYTPRLPRGVKVNGVNVGGMTVAAAKSRLREGVTDDLKQKRLRICSDERVYSFAYPEIDFTDGFGELLPSIKKKGEYSAPVNYYLNGFGEIVGNICSDVYVAPREPYAVYNCAGAPFTYYEGEDGRECDKEKLEQDIKSSLNGGFEQVNICARVLKRSLTDSDIKERTKKLYSFTTYFDGDNSDRSENIRIAASKINGTVIEPDGVFSFNGVVGARTEENGFKPAKIIEDGKFVLGYGGGVCQVSTTLYNAALLSGLEVCEYHPHSLQVSYVAPSRDAMVSGSRCDLKFKNTRKTPIYVRATCTLSSITCIIYGESDGYGYSFKSTVTERVPRPPAEYVDGEEDRVVSYGREGTKSEGYLIRRGEGGEECKLIRKDKYLAVADVVERVKGE